MENLHGYLDILKKQRKWELDRWVEAICAMHFAMADSISSSVLITEMEIRKVTKELGL